jgi:hypothetical protein
MAGMELLQFLTLLYSAQEEVSAEYDAPAALPWKKLPFFVEKRARGRGGGSLEVPSVDCGKGKGFYHLQRFIARLSGCPAITIVTAPTELSGVTHMSLFLDCHECLYVAGLE